MEVFTFEKRIKHYTSYQKILLVGEGDFSFAVCLARAFGFAINMVATSLDSRELLMVKYSRAMSNVKELEDRGCIVLHEVDVHRMSQHPFLSYFRFDRIIYNFPHAGYLYGPFSSERDQFQICVSYKYQRLWKYKLGPDECRTQGIGKPKIPIGNAMQPRCKSTKGGVARSDLCT